MRWAVQVELTKRFEMYAEFVDTGVGCRVVIKSHLKRYKL